MILQTVKTIVSAMTTVTHKLPYQTKRDKFIPSILKYNTIFKAVMETINDHGLQGSKDKKLLSLQWRSGLKAINAEMGK